MALASPASPGEPLPARATASLGHRLLGWEGAGARGSWFAPRTVGFAGFQVLDTPLNRRLGHPTGSLHVSRSAATAALTEEPRLR